VTDLRSFQPAAGWYPDPAGQSGQRWWDGLGWTEYVRATPPSAPTIPAAAVVPSVPEATPYRPFADRDAHQAAGAEPVYRPFADRDARFAVAPAAAATWSPRPTDNPAATRAAIAAALLVVLLVASLLLNLPVGLPLVATGVAIVFGILGLVRSRETLSGLKRSIAAVVVGVVALGFSLVSLVGAFALASLDLTADIEDSLVALYNSSDPAVEAAAAECAHVDLPRKGDTIPCTVIRTDGIRLDVVLEVTSDNGSYVVTLPD
jgi:hypothetical protein